MDAASPSRVPAPPQASLLPRRPGTGTPRCRRSVPASCARQRCQMFGRRQAEVPGAGRTVPAAPQPLVCPAARCVHGIAIFPGWHCVLPSPGLAPAPVPACLLPASLLIVPAGWESSWTAIWLILVSLCLSLLTLWHQHLRFSAQCFALPTLRSPGSGVPTLASVQFDKLAFSVFRIISSSYSGAFPNKYSILQE